MSSKLFVNYIAEAEDITGAENVQIVTSNDTLCRNISKALDALCIPPRANLFLSAVIAPRTVEDLRKLLRLFHRVKIPVWQFYSTEEEDLRHVIPRVPGSIGLDLAKYMNKIVEVNQDQLYAIVEPGVSYAALARDVSQRGLDDQFWIDWPSSSRELIIDHVLGSESAAGSCGMEIILPKGDILQTGVLNPHKERGLPKALEHGLANGLVPVHCLGVISKILRPKASECQPFLITFSKSDHLLQAIDIARKLHLSGLIHHDVRLRHIFLESGVLSRLSTPINATTTSSTHSTSSSLAQELHLDYWNLYGVINQPETLRALTWETIKKSFEDEAMEAIKFHLPDEDSPTNFRDYTQERSCPRFSALTDTEDLRSSTTDASALQSTHTMCSRTSRIVTGSTAQEMLETSSKRGQEADYELMNEFVLTRDRLIHNIHILSPTHDSKAPKTVQTLVRNLLKDTLTHRWADFRTHSVLMDQIISHSASAESDFWQRAMITSAKDAVDSSGILAPGKHGIWPKQASSGAWETVIENF
ncbi:unnamed protein product [Penicillium pancosmium]